VAWEHALDSISDRLQGGAKASLSSPIEMHELEEALKGMVVGKSSGPDGVIVEFYKVYWEVIGADFHEMIQEAIRLGRLPTGVTKGLISLLHKGGGVGAN
jgi:hypothetical protein